MVPLFLFWTSEQEISRFSFLPLTILTTKEHLFPMYSDKISLLIDNLFGSDGI